MHITLFLSLSHSFLSLCDSRMSKRVFEEIAPKKSKEESEDEEENKETCPPDPVLAFILAPSEQIHWISCPSGGHHCRSKQRGNVDSYFDRQKILFQ